MQHYQTDLGNEDAVCFCTLGNIFLNIMYIKQIFEVLPVLELKGGSTSDIYICVCIHTHTHILTSIKLLIPLEGGFV
jgi:hypothetical protein